MVPSRIFQTAALLVFPVVLVFSLEHLVHGTSQPGEGFSSGLLVALSIVLLYVGLGVREVDAEIPRLAHFGVTVGLSAMVAVSWLGVVGGDEALRMYGAEFSLGGVEGKLSTTLLFDAGVFLVLAGGATAIFRSVGLERDEEEGP